MAIFPGAHNSHVLVVDNVFPGRFFSCFLPDQNSGPCLIDDTLSAASVDPSALMFMSPLEALSRFHRLPALGAICFAVKTV